MNPDASFSRRAAPGTLFDAPHASARRGMCAGSAYLHSGRRAAAPYANTLWSSTSGLDRSGCRCIPRSRTAHSQTADIRHFYPPVRRGRRRCKTSGPDRTGCSPPRSRAANSQGADIRQFSPPSPRGRRQGAQSRECSLREHRITAMSREARAVTRASTTVTAWLSCSRQRMKSAPARGIFHKCRRPGRSSRQGVSPRPGPGARNGSNP